MNVRTSILAALAALAGALPLAAQTDDETWAQLLLDHPLERGGDADRVVASWVAMVVDEPDHPLVDATLALIAERAPALREPARLPAVVDALRSVSEAFTPAAARRFALFSADVAGRFLPAERLDVDLHPGWLAHAWVLGPLFPTADPRAVGREPLLLAPFDPAQVVRGPEGDVTWTSLERRPTSPVLDAAEAVFPGHGWVLLACEFDVAGGGPGFLEFDVGSALSGSALTPPVWAWSLSGEAPEVEDEALPPRSPVQRRGVVFRDGRNRLVLHAHVDSGLRFAVRVLGADGRPHPGLGEAREPAPPGVGALGGGSPSPGVLDGSLEHLERKDARSPDEEALLGVLLFGDGRPPQGLAHLRRAVDELSGSPGLLALLARLTERAGYLPETWRRTRARALVEQAHELDPLRLDAGLALADVLRREDRDQEAAETLRALGEAHPRQVESLLALASLHDALRMEASADEARAEAWARAPECPRVLEALAARDAAVGRVSRAFERRQLALRAGGATPSALARLSDLARALGRPEQALALLEEAEAREGRPGESLARAQLLADLGRAEEAQAILGRVLARHPRWSWPASLAADAARAAGDAAAERRFLERAAAASPGWRVVRDRLDDAGVPDVARELFARFDVPTAEALAGYDPSGQSDSVVRVLDAAVVVILGNGVIDFLTHEVSEARDLAGCEALGTQRAQGDVLALRVIDRDGTVHEPVLVDGEYVMPSLEPGDFVESVTRTIWNAPWDGVVRPGRWTFASDEQPFLRSRYVVAVADGLPLEIHEGRFDGTHETFDEGAFTVHVWETLDRARVLPEPFAPPREWFLPWVEVGAPRDVEAGLEGLRRQTLALATVTPEIEEAARGALPDPSVGDEEKARALFAFVRDALDQRSPQWGMSATASLLAREGNPCFLYAALLSAADVPHALVWTRGVEPGGDPDPDPAFPEASRVQGDLLVRVDPRDGPSVLCDLSSRTMPFGVWKQDAPRAEAFVVTARSGERAALPDVPDAERPGLVLELDLTLDEAGAADVRARAALTGGPGHLFKEQVGEVPKAFLTLVANQIAGQILPGITLSDVQLVGLDDERPLAAEVAGRIERYLDEDDGELVTALPFPALDLAASLAGEGPRRLPFFFPSGWIAVQRLSAVLHVPDGLQPVELPEGLRLEIAGARYALDLERDEDGALHLRRELLVPPISVPAREHAGLLEAARRIDEAERGRLRFVRR